MNKIKEFEDELHHTMPLWHENALNTCDNEEDRDFLLCMMGTHPTIKYREASYSTKDVKTAKKFEKYEARKAKEKQYIQKQKEKSSVEDRVLQSDNEDSDVVVSLITYLGLEKVAKNVRKIKLNFKIHFIVIFSKNKF